MGITINIPNIGEDALEVTEILVKVGDTISINQPLLIIEGDKSSIEIPSLHSGIIEELYIKIGDKVHTGSIILSIKKNNDFVHTKFLKETESIVPSNTNKVTTSTKFENIEFKDTLHNDIQCNIQSQIQYNSIIYATPVIRHMARKLGLNLLKIKGSGRKGRITKKDIQNYLSIISEKHKKHNITTVTTQSLPKTKSDIDMNFDKFGEITTIPLNKIQKISGFNLQKNWSTIPHVTQFDIVDVTSLETFRKKQNLEFEQKKINYKITMLIFIIKAVAKALEKLPRFNSSLSEDGNTLILKKYINIGIAVDTKKGLLVPVLRNVNNKGIITLSQELSEIIQKARSGTQLSPIDMKGGSFTISNLGAMGGSAFTPIINSPEVAILGVSKSSIHPVWSNTKFVPRLMLPLSLSYDHRVINGADGAKFMNSINKIISDIRLLLM